MRLPRTQYTRTSSRMLALVSALVLMVGCASAPSAPEGSVEARHRLTTLQSDAELATLAPVEIRAAEAAVALAEQQPPRGDAALSAHRVYLAQQKVELAWARAGIRHAEVQRRVLGEARETARLQARTLEADQARGETQQARTEAERARGETEQARIAAEQARGETEQARIEAERARADASRSRSASDAAQAQQSASAATAARQEAELQRQIDALQAQVTERGLVLTLGDVLFETNSAELQSGSNTNLDRLVSFLQQYPERRVLIEGHTDNVGNADFNRHLSHRRADAVRSYLIQHGLPTERMSVSGVGMDRPVATNSTAAGRQQNRRVEIIIENPTVTATNL